MNLYTNSNFLIQGYSFPQSTWLAPAAPAAASEVSDQGTLEATVAAADLGAPHRGTQGGPASGKSGFCPRILEPPIVKLKHIEIHVAKHFGGSILETMTGSP